MEEYITKQRLLRREGISYGRLYRWKRMGLIPEEWFIKKASPTGQQTVLPQKKILERIDLIKRLMKTMSLEEIADRLAFDRKKKVIEFGRLYRLEYMDVQYVNAVGNYFKKDGYTAPELMMMVCRADLADREKFTVRQYVDLLRYALPLARKIEKLSVRCVFFARGGDWHTAVYTLGSRCLFDDGLRIAGDYNFETVWGRLSVRIPAGGSRAPSSFVGSVEDR